MWFFSSLTLLFLNTEILPSEALKPLCISLHLFSRSWIQATFVKFGISPIVERHGQQRQNVVFRDSKWKFHLKIHKTRRWRTSRNWLSTVFRICVVGEFHAVNKSREAQILTSNCKRKIIISASKKTKQINV